MHPQRTERESPSLKVWVSGYPRCTERDGPSLKVWVPGLKRCTDQKSPSLKVWMPGHPRHSVKVVVKNPCLKKDKVTHDVRTVSFLTMYKES